MSPDVRNREGTVTGPQSEATNSAQTLRSTVDRESDEEAAGTAVSKAAAEHGLRIRMDATADEVLELVFGGSESAPVGSKEWVSMEHGMVPKHTMFTPPHAMLLMSAILLSAGSLGLVDYIVAGAAAIHPFISAFMGLMGLGWAATAVPMLIVMNKNAQRGDA